LVISKTRRTEMWMIGLNLLKKSLKKKTRRLILKRRLLKLKREP